jgi:hypothetical protein
LIGFYSIAEVKIKFRGLFVKIDFDKQGNIEVKRANSCNDPEKMRKPACQLYYISNHLTAQTIICLLLWINAKKKVAPEFPMPPE